MLRQAEPRIADCEADLLASAKLYCAQMSLDELTEDVIRDVSQTKGTDFGTAWLYGQICGWEQHGSFIKEIDDTQDSTKGLSDWDVRVLIVPGAFYKNFPTSGADGRLVRAAASDCGLDVDVVPIHGFGSLQENAQIVCRWLLEHPPRPTVLVSLCKGAADVRMAMSRPDAAEAFRNVLGWVSLSGIYFGTPMSDWVSSRFFWKHWYRCLLKLQGYGFNVLQQLSRVGDVLAIDDGPMPDSITRINVVGFPLQRHLKTKLIRRCYQRILPQGPNDGGGILLADVCRLPGHVYPVWGADHYLRPDSRDMTRLVRQLLHWLKQQDCSVMSGTQRKSVAL